LKPENRNSKLLLISFSGIDGAGKSTQIENLSRILTERGFSRRLLAFWDHVVVGCRWRESFVHVVYKSERGVGAPGKPVQRRDKNIRKRYLNVARHGLYLADALHLSWVVARERRLARRGREPRAIVLDRYIYDELANLPLHNPISRLFIRLISGIVPRPDIAFLLDADPEAAHARKPEYSVEFMQKSRAAYFRLAELLGNMTIIPPLPLEEAKQALEIAWRRQMGEAAAVDDIRPAPSVAAA
jgi:thymidylate kinase